MFGYLFSVIQCSIMLIPYACNAVLVCRNLVFNNSGRSGQKRIIAFLGQIPPPPRWVRTAIVLLLAINIVSWAKLLMMSCFFFSVVSVQAQRGFQDWKIQYLIKGRFLVSLDVSR